MRPAPSLAFLLLAACGPSPPGEVACVAGTLIVKAGVGVELDCAAVRSDVAIALRTFESQDAPTRWRLSLQDLDGPFSGLPVFVHRDPTFQRDGRSWVGRFSLDGGIELGSRGEALPHELMHALDVERGQALTGFHWDWDWTFDEQLTARMSGAWSL